MKKKVLIGLVIFSVLSAGSLAFARKKGIVHYSAKCKNCSCTEFVSDADSTYKCYNCGHADYMHDR